MSVDYSQEMMKKAVARICQHIGFHSINSYPLEIITDVSYRYIKKLSKSIHDYANEFGFLSPTMDHVALAFHDMRINLQDLEEYVVNVDSIPPCPPIPEFPIKRENHLNFLKPGSKEVVTRPIHIHEHLPPMFQVMENENDDVAVKKSEEVVDDIELNKEENYLFKRPPEVMFNDSLIKRPRLLVEDEGRPTREISSVMMTTSGFLSPAREGKLPEARTPIPAQDNPPIINHPVPSPTTPQQSILQPTPSPAINEIPLVQEKKTNKVVKKVDKKKDKVVKDTSKLPTEGDMLLEKATKPKKNTNKDNKSRPAKNTSSSVSTTATESKADGKLQNTQYGNKISNAENKLNKTLAAARLKTEKFNTTITPISPLVEEKLSSEPDKNKLNIFKKISNVKNEKIDKVTVTKIKEEIKQESRESSPDLIIDESLPPFPKNVKNIEVPIQVTNPSILKTIDSVVSMTNEEKPFPDDYLSPPSSPRIPKTPEIINQSPPLPLGKEKRKRKDKSKVKKVKVPKIIESHHIDSEKPKTPEPIQPLVSPNIPFSFFPPFPGGPGLIPASLSNNPLLPRFPGIPPLVKHNFGQQPTLPASMHIISPLPPKEEQIEKPIELNVVTSPIQETTPILPISLNVSPKTEKKSKEHKKEKKEKVKKKNKKDKIKNKAEKKKLKEEKKEKVKIKKEKREKRKEKELSSASRENEIAVPKLTLKLGPASPRPLTPDSHMSRKLLIKPIVKKEEEPLAEIKREPSPELARISALVTGHPKLKTAKEPSPGPTRTTPGPGRPRIHPQKTTKTRPASIKDNEGKTVWICPACGGQDDGSPMIGCDDCDAWYHWVCVGIQVPPDANEDWYCRVCIGKKQEALQFDKKKKRKRKEKKDLGFE